ncbi:Protein kinase-like domain [Pseudocohnilembus persalinus]|uniref:Protein kinase-like domain n=1 Tax=Pseudocohnilembus persalinus TaxID=266149 RepID=A0A0V0QA94_PSEPJ|nr:Protein kinase-like domain [Pseudocohnilembus persalinus]|eukprot:KRW99125.1 Protein kinase-like domain [Pseudocohnilembus persalinus]
MARNLLEILLILKNAKIMHRNISHKSLLVVKDQQGNFERIKLTSFGICKYHDPKCQTNTVDIEYKDTIAPEILKRDSRYNQMVDIYSAGMTLCKLIFGLEINLIKNLKTDNSEYYDAYVQNIYKIQKMIQQNEKLGKDFSDLLIRMIDPDYEHKRINIEQIFKHNFFLNFNDLNNCKQQEQFTDLYGENIFLDPEYNNYFEQDYRNEQFKNYGNVSKNLINSSLNISQSENNNQIFINNQSSQNNEISIEQGIQIEDLYL